MTVHAGDDAIYRPARGKPKRVRVYGHTAKRVAIVIHDPERGFAEFLVCYVRAEKLERLGGGAPGCRSGALT
jgi:hypothetical protein